MTVSLGEINLKGVNVKPDKASELMYGLGMPFQLKAGTIGNLKIQIKSYMGLFSSQPNLPTIWTIKDLFVIIGPSMAFRSDDEDFIPAHEDLITPYDESNMYNIFQNTLSVKGPRASTRNTGKILNLLKIALEFEREANNLP